MAGITAAAAGERMNPASTVRVPARGKIERVTYYTLALSSRKMGLRQAAFDDGHQVVIYKD